MKRVPPINGKLDDRDVDETDQRDDRGRPRGTAHVIQRAGLHRLPVPRTVDELRDAVVAHFGQIDALDDLARAAMASPASEEVRRLNMPDRTAAFRRLADSIEPPPSRADRDRIARLLMILTASSAQRMWRDHFGSSVEEAADDIDWIVRAAVAAATRRNDR